MKECCIRVGKERIPVSQEVYDEYHKSIERMKYLRKLEKSRVISYEQALDDELPIEAIMTEQQDLVADIVLNRLLIEQMKKCIKLLDDEDRALIQMLFFDEISERSFTSVSGISRSTIRSRKHRALRRLKKLMKL